MELSCSTINNTVKLCILASLFGFLFLLLFNQNDQYTWFSTPHNTIVKLPSFNKNESDAPFSTQTSLLPTEITINNFIDKQPNSTQIINHEKNPSNIALNNKYYEEENNNHTIIKEECNMFEGRWIYKAEENPMYDISKCPFIEEKMSCQKNGRPDSDYEKWSWEATHCNIPLFDGRDMLERLRNKRVAIVGDSLNRNMWESLACLLYSSVPSSTTEIKTNRAEYKELKVKDYNTTIEFYWSPFLVEYNIENHQSGKKVIVLDKISPHSKQWIGADIMVFNSGHWWTHKRKINRWDFIQYKGQLFKEMPIKVAYGKSLRTWAKWVKKNVDPRKTIVFFRSISAQHNIDAKEQWCYNATQPIMDESYKNMFPQSHINIVERLIKKMNSPNVRYLKITKLSSYRIDAHPSVYKSLDWNIIVDASNHQRPVRPAADCSHWCLPGLPDTWNRLLYASLLFDTWGNMPNT